MVHLSNTVNLTGKLPPANTVFCTNSTYLKWEYNIIVIEAPRGIIGSWVGVPNFRKIIYKKGWKLFTRRGGNIILVAAIISIYK